MKIEKKEHLIYKEWIKAKQEGINFSQIVDRWQYIYSSSKGEISMVRFLNYFKKGDNFWEIYCLKGNLFDDVERFRVKKKAIERIKSWLNE